MTAVPNAGATYDRSEWTFHLVWKDTFDGGETWNYLIDEDRHYTTWQTVMQPNLPESNSYMGDGRYLGYEGTRTDYTSSLPDTLFVFEFTLQSVTIYFKGSHVPTHLIIRDDTTGKIMIGGAQNKILRDD